MRLDGLSQSHIVDIDIISLESPYSIEWPIKERNKWNATRINLVNESPWVNIRLFFGVFLWCFSHLEYSYIFFGCLFFVGFVRVKNKWMTLKQLHKCWQMFKYRWNKWNDVQDNRVCSLFFSAWEGGWGGWQEEFFRLLSSNFVCRLDDF